MSEADDYLADLRAELAITGDEIVIRRYSGTAKPRNVSEARVYAHVGGAAGEVTLDTALAAARRQVVAINDPLATVGAGDVALSALLPLSDKDQAVIDGKVYAIARPRPRLVAGVVIAVEFEAVG